MEYANIISESKEYITSLLNSKLDPSITFHTIHHTKNVARGAALMAQFYRLSEWETTILITSAWFHDIGHIQQSKGHEKISQEILYNFFKYKDIPHVFVEECAICIQATEVGKKPTNHLAAIIKDADFFHITLPNYWMITEQLKEEIEYQNNTHINCKDWYDGNLQFLQSLQFFTNYYNQKFHGIKDRRIFENKRILKDFNFSYENTKNKALTL